LAALLGISVNEACAELCGLMAVVGPTASFVFERLPSTKTTTCNTSSATQQQQQEQKLTGGGKSPAVVSKSSKHLRISYGDDNISFF